MKRRAIAVLVAALLLAGAAFMIGTVDRSPQLRDIDEAAWIYNGYFFNLLISGDLKNPDWNAFDMYANHPPAGAYLFGALMNAIGEPVKSVEPRRFYFENDLDIVNFREPLLAELSARLTPRQLVAGRYLSAAIGWAAAALLFAFMWRIAGPAAGAASYALLLMHPAFLSVARLASVDTFLIMLSILSAFAAYEMGRAWGGGRLRAWGMCALAAVSLGLLFSTKVSTFTWAAAIVMAAAAGSGEKRQLARAVAASFAAIAGAFAISWILDPGLYAHPLAVTASRMEWRLMRIEIQRMVFIAEAFETIPQRIAFAGFICFLMSGAAYALGAIPAAGFLSGRLLRARDPLLRGELLIIALAIYSTFLVLMMLPIAWVHYVTACIPFLAALAGLGAVRILRFIAMRRELPAQRIVAFFASAALIVAAFSFTSREFRQHRWFLPRQPTAEEARISHMFAFSLAHPGVDREVHRALVEYFDARGEGKWADYERHWQNEMEKKPDGGK